MKSTEFRILIFYKKVIKSDKQKTKKSSYQKVL